VKRAKAGETHIIRFDPGEEIVSGLAAFCEQAGVIGAAVQGIGSVATAEIGHFDPERGDYVFRRLDGPLEVLALTGNVAALDGRPMVHVHAVLSDRAFTTQGGHLRSATVAVTCEVVLTLLSAPVRRKREPGKKTALLDL
jgi:uncharacterized protein